MNDISEKKPLRTMVDLFAGCGGLSLGFEEAGFTPVFVNELHQDALRTYLANRRHELGGEKFSENPRLHSNDARELSGPRLEELIADLSSIPEIDLQFEKGDVSAGGGSSLDVVTGGPPCQGYSGIGIRRSYKVNRKDIPSNHLYEHMAGIIGGLRPRIFLFENVRGLLNAKWTKDCQESIWSKVKNRFSKIPGYQVRWSLVHAKNYGVPQNRPRVLLVGIRNDIVEVARCHGILDPDADQDAEDAVACGFLPKGNPGAYPDIQDLLGDLVDSSVSSVLLTQAFKPGPFQTTEYPRAPKKGTIQEKLRQPPIGGTDTLTELTEQQYSKHRKDVVAKFDYMLKNKGEIPPHYRTKKFSQRVLPKRWDGSGPNITATSLPDDYVHYSQPRILTVREWARLQLFPDWYQFCGARTTGGVRRAGNPLVGQYERELPKYTQIGNAVPVGLAMAIGRHFAQILRCCS